MYDPRYPPELELSRTISHPLEDVRVVGFKGRDTLYGVDAVVLKGEEVPRDGDVLGIFERAIRLMEEGGHALYVLMDETVAATVSEQAANATPKEFDTHFGKVSLQSLDRERFDLFDRGAVEVGLP